MASRSNSGSNYSSVIAQVFADHYKKGLKEFTFLRDEISNVVQQLGIPCPKNLGDVVYAFRYRKRLPASITKTQPAGYEWIIEGAGTALYRFRLVRQSRIVPNKMFASIKIPDATPEIIGNYAFSDEQALLAKVRYNRLIDTFLGITAYSLQNHLRTTVKGIGQIEIDEIYIAVDKHGRQFVIPVQAKGGNDQHGVVQTRQDVACCASKFPELICRPVSVQFVSPTEIAMFEMTEIDGEIKIADEKHYHLVPAAEITHDDLLRYKRDAFKTNKTDTGDSSGL